MERMGSLANEGKEVAMINNIMINIRLYGVP